MRLHSKGQGATPVVPYSYVCGGKTQEKAERASKELTGDIAPGTKGRKDFQTEQLTPVETNKMRIRKYLFSFLPWRSLAE